MQSPRLGDARVFIYKDAGVSDACFAQWEARFSQRGIVYKSIDADSITRGGLEHAAFFVLPGGADLPYCEKLNGAGNRALRAFVEGGGVFVGVCAGAYYMHEAVRWNNPRPDGTHEVIEGARELAFFQGAARGPLRPYQAQSERGAVLVPVHSGNLRAWAYYNGGPVMSGMSGDPEAEVTAWFEYEGLEYPAVMLGRVGRGRAVALAVHLEYTEDALAGLALGLVRAQQYQARASEDQEREASVDARDRQAMFDRIFDGILAAAGLP